MSGKRPLFFGEPPVSAADLENPTIRWIVSALRQIEASSQDDVGTIADQYVITGTLTKNRTIDVAAPTAANTADVLATLLSDLQRRGARRSREENG